MAKRKTSASSPICKCTADGCDRDATRKSAKLCEMHYYRMRRNGTLELLADIAPPPADLVHSHGYILEHAPDHPLWSRASGRVYQHRRVYYDKHGEGPFSCHWCGVQVEWDGMHVDHVNAVRDDNRIENLVASCPGCNQERGHHKMKVTHRARSKTRLEWNGEDLCVSEWAERIGISAASMQWRIAQGWDVERICTQPRGKFGPKGARK